MPFDLKDALQSTITDTLMKAWNGFAIEPSSILELKTDPGVYNPVTEQETRLLMSQVAAYAESGPLFDPSGEYRCGTCQSRWGVEEGNDVAECALVTDKISLRNGSCRMYTNGPLITIQYDLYNPEEALYTERPSGIGFGCHNCEHGIKVKEADAEGRSLYCTQFMVRVQPLACCDRNEMAGDITPGE